MEILSQIFAVLAIVCNIVCFQMKDKKKLLFWQITACVMFIANLALKSAWTGVLMNIHAAARLTVYYLAPDHKWARSKIWLPVFMISAAAMTALSYENIFDALALVGTLFTIYSFSRKSPAMTRLFTIPSPPCWFAYHLSHKNIGCVNEIFVITSIIIGIIRIDIPAYKKNKAKTTEI